MVDKVIQLYETKNSRHSVMMVGQTGTAKTAIWRTLQRALTEMANKGEDGYVPVKVGTRILGGERWVWRLFLLTGRI